jgi:hypothetical protein
MHSHPAFTQWLRLGFSACVIAVTSLMVGAVIGLLAVVPALSELTPSEATPRWDASRFERLVLDVNAPDPPPYRTPTPAHGMPTPPGYGALARAKARGATERSIRRAAKVQSRSSAPLIGKQAADAFAHSPAPLTDRPSYPRRDRHTTF